MVDDEYVIAYSVQRTSVRVVFGNGPPQMESTVDRLGRLFVWSPYIGELLVGPTSN